MVTTTAKDQDNIHVYGGEGDTVWLAPLGSTLPLGLGPLDAAFKDVGFLSESGMDFNREVESTDIKVHQGGKIVRTKVNASGRKFVFRPVEDNEIVEDLVDIVLARDETDGVVHTKYSDGSEVKSFACVVDKYDGGNMDRRCFARLDVVTTGTESWTNSAATEVECTGTVIGDHDRWRGPIPVPATP